MFQAVSGGELLPYGIDNIKGTKECIITEGEMDALSFFECGRHDVVSVPNGANSNLDYLDNYIEEYFDDKETIYIASDTDTKGVILKDELIRRFGVERCRVLEYGEGCKDANEHLIKYGRESLLKCLADAPEIKLEGVFSVSDFEQSLDALFEHGMQKGVTIGHDNFDRLCSFETKRLCIVTGIPGSGKSEFIDEIAERLNMRYGWRFAYFSPENAPLAYHASKLIEKFTGKKFGKETLTFGEYRQVKEHLEQNFFFIAPKQDYRVETILERAKFLVRRKGIKALVIDPYNRLEDESEGQNETKYISRLLDKLTNFAQMNDILIILMAHPTKQPKNKDGIIEAPTLYDISGSANFFNKADFGIVVHRNRLENTIEVHIQKVKFRHLGECGTALFKYNLNNGVTPPTQTGKSLFGTTQTIYRKKSSGASRKPLKRLTLIGTISRLSGRKRKTARSDSI
jgi:twinkle protein